MTDQLSQEIDRGIVRGRQRIRIVTRETGAWVEENYPDWTILDSDDGLSHPDGTTYLLEAC